MTPLSSESTTARATAAWAGPNICTACFAPLIVTLLNRSVSGFAGRLGATTARSVVKPSLLFASALQKAAPAGPVFEPMIKSMCATSLPSPTRDSPRKKSAMSNNSFDKSEPRAIERRSISHLGSGVVSRGPNSAATVPKAGHYGILHVHDFFDATETVERIATGIRTPLLRRPAGEAGEGDCLRRHGGV